MDLRRERCPEAENYFNSARIISNTLKYLVPGRQPQALQCFRVSQGCANLAWIEAERSDKGVLIGRTKRLSPAEIELGRSRGNTSIATRPSTVLNDKDMFRMHWASPVLEDYR